MSVRSGPGHVNSGHPQPEARIRPVVHPNRVRQQRAIGGGKPRPSLATIVTVLGAIAAVLTGLAAVLNAMSALR